MGDERDAQARGVPQSGDDRGVLGPRGGAKHAVGGRPDRRPLAHHLRRASFRARVEAMTSEVLAGHRLEGGIDVAELGAQARRPRLRHHEYTPVGHLGHRDAGRGLQSLFVVERGGELAAGLGQKRRAARHLLQVRERLAPLAADLELAQLARHGRAQARQVALEHVIVGARLHGLDGLLLADVPGDDDERHVDLPFLQDLESVEPPPARQAIVRDHRVPGFPIERLEERGPRIHPRCLG
jgi:hypothetical protein